MSLFANVFSDSGKIEAVLHLEMISQQATLPAHQHLNSALSLKHISHCTKLCLWQDLLNFVMEALSGKSWLLLFQRKVTKWNMRMESHSSEMLPPPTQSPSSFAINRYGFGKRCQLFILGKKIVLHKSFVKPRHSSDFKNRGKFLVFYFHTSHKSFGTCICSSSYSLFISQSNDIRHC